LKIDLPNVKNVDCSIKSGNICKTLSTTSNYVNSYNQYIIYFISNFTIFKTVFYSTYWAYWQTRMIKSILTSLEIFSTSLFRQIVTNFQQMSLLRVFSQSPDLSYTNTLGFFIALFQFHLPSASTTTVKIP
jgi:hypothetical protein